MSVVHIVMPEWGGAGSASGNQEKTRNQSLGQRGELRGDWTTKQEHEATLGGTTSRELGDEYLPDLALWSLPHSSPSIVLHWPNPTGSQRTREPMDALQAPEQNGQVRGKSGANGRSEGQWAPFHPL